MARHIFVAFSSPVPGKEEEFARWYDTHHLPDVLEVPGFVSGQRFRVVRRHPEELTRDHKALVLYEIDTDDPQATITEMRRRITEGQLDTGTLFDPAFLGFYLATADGPEKFASLPS